MVPSASPTVRRRRLAAELRRLRGTNRTANEVARAIGWSPTKISRAESERDNFPPGEVEKLLDYYGVTEPLRGRLLGMAEVATQRSWWDDYADALSPELMEFIGLETEAVSSLQWQADAVPGLLQTEAYARQLSVAYQENVLPTPPSVVERFVETRMRRQERLTAEPVLELKVVIDEAVLLRRVGDKGLMRAQLEHLAAVSNLPNVDLRILPLDRDIALLAGSFVIMSFGSPSVPETASLGDVVSTENLNTELYISGETDTYLYRLFFQAVTEASLSQTESRNLIFTIVDSTWR